MKKCKVICVVIFAVAGVFAVRYLTHQEVSNPLLAKSNESNKPLASPFDEVLAIQLPQPRQNIEGAKVSEHADDELSVIQIESAIKQMESQLEESNTIERLNSDVVNQEERQEIASKFDELNALREKNLALRLAEIEREVSELEKTHAMRLEAYGIKMP